VRGPVVPPEILAGQRALFGRLSSGDAARVGWKIGHAIEEIDALGVELPVVGCITTATVLSDGEAFPADGARELRGETEIALELARSVDADADDDAVRAAIAGRRVALEIVDVARTAPGARSIIEGNVFHRAVVFGGALAELGEPVGRATLAVGATLHHQDDEPPCALAAVRGVAAMLTASGRAGLAAGDKILTGSLVHVAISPGDRLCAEIEGLGRVSARVTA
jgi:2-keto-4-pentenoate hydratase